MGKKEIYKTLINAGLNPKGACAIMGNMMAESALRANNAQDGMTSMSDEAYTQAVDSGAYLNFEKDSVGYGLCQWTFHTRKKALLDFCKAHGASIGDEKAQTEFCIEEMKTDYLPLWNFLCKTEDLYTATSRVCTEYERPAVNNITARHNFALELYKELSVLPTKDELDEINYINSKPIDAIDKPVDANDNKLKGKLTNETVWHIQSILATYGYDFGKTDGIIGDKTKTALKAFTNDFINV